LTEGTRSVPRTRGYPRRKKVVAVRPRTPGGGLRTGTGRTAV